MADLDTPPAAAPDDIEARWCGGYDAGLAGKPCAYPDDRAYNLGWRSGRKEREAPDVE